jgi:FMN phosphatase YigB (HAD superfamily)
VSGLELIVDLDGTVYRGDAPVRRYAELIAAALPSASGRAYLAAVERYLAEGPPAALGSADAGEAAALRAAPDPWQAALGLATRRYGVPASVTASAFGRCRAWMAGPECPVEVVEPLLTVLAELRPAARISLVTNTGPASLAPFLSRLGLTSRFDQVIADAGKPEGLRRLLAEVLGDDLAARPWRAFSLGDHYANDIAPAAAIGAGSGYIDRYRQSSGPATATAATAEGLLPALRAWAADPAGTVAGGIAPAVLTNGEA